MGDPYVKKLHVKKLHVQDPWLEQIILGNKLVEGRKGPREKYAGLIGKKVMFYNEQIRILVKVKDVRHYSTLYEYLNMEKPEKVAPHIGDNYDAVVNVYHKFASDEEIKKSGGFNGIVVKFIRVLT